MTLENWIAGPQIVGVVLLITGFILYRFPPKHINNWCGYKMPSAKKNQKTWDEANRYSALCMIKSGLIVLVAGLLITLILKEVAIPSRLKEGLTALFLIASGPIPCIFIITATEKHLEKTFDQKPE